MLKRLCDIKRAKKTYYNYLSTKIEHPTLHVIFILSLGFSKYKSNLRFFIFIFILFFYLL
jgi:hypothetical protein